MPGPPQFGEAPVTNIRILTTRTGAGGLAGETGTREKSLAMRLDTINSNSQAFSRGQRSTVASIRDGST
jgi:hypothetical protein